MVQPLWLCIKKGKIEGYKKVWETFLKYHTLLDEIELENKDYFLDARELLLQKKQRSDTTNLT